MCHLFRLVASHLTGLRTSWITPSHPAYFFYFFFFFFILSSLLLFSCLHRGSPLPPSSARHLLFLIFAKRCVGVSPAAPVLSLQPAGSLLF